MNKAKLLSWNSDAHPRYARCSSLECRATLKLIERLMPFLNLGILAMCQGFTHSYHGLHEIRFLMVIFEIGLRAGASLLITSYYRKKEWSQYASVESRYQMSL